MPPGLACAVPGIDAIICIESLKNFHLAVVAPITSRRLGHQLPSIILSILCLAAASRLDAQTYAYSLLRPFSAPSSGINVGEANPKGKLLVYPVHTAHSNWSSGPAAGLAISQVEP
jgi:hypothetical protein